MSTFVIGILLFFFMMATFVMLFNWKKYKKLHEKEILESQTDERFNRTLKAARIGSWEWDLKDDSWFASPTYYTMLGYEPKLGPADRSEWIERTHPDDRAFLQERIQNVLENEPGFNEYEARLLAADGTYRWQRITVLSIERGPDGKATRLMGIRKDINDRKQAVEALQANEKRLRSIFEDSPISIWEEDFSEIRRKIDEARKNEVHDWAEFFATKDRIIEFYPLIKILDVNRATVKLLECVDKKEALRKLPDFFDEDSIDVFRSELITLAEGNRTFECESIMNTSKGKRVFLQLKLNIVPGFEESWERVLVSLVDLSERKVAEVALEESEAKFRGLVEQSSEGIMLFDKTGILLDCNPVLSNLAGIEKKDLVGQPIWKAGIGLMPEPLRAIEGFDNLGKQWELGRGEEIKAESYESTVELGSGVKRVIDHSFFPIFKNADLLIGDIIHDVTEQRETAKAIIDSLREKELLLSEVHHRVKNNLQVICSLINLQIDKSTVSSKEEHELRDMETRVRAMSLVHELLYQSDGFTSIDFATYVRHLTGHLLNTYEQDRSRVQIIVWTNEVSLSIEKAIPCGLIINELVVNALKHAFPDGRTGEIRIELNKADDQSAVLIVRDNGIGLSKKLDNTDGHHGIGIMLVENLAMQLHGACEFISDGGLLVRVVFPT